MITRRRVALVVAAVAAALAVARGEDRVEDASAIESRLAEARRALAQAAPDERPILEPGLIATEQALARYRALAAQGETRRRVSAPLWVAGGVLIADDATGVGVGDDPLLVVVGLGLAATYLATSAPLEQTQLDQEWRRVLALAARTGDDALTLRVRRAALDAATPVATRAALEVLRRKGLAQIAAEVGARRSLLREIVPGPADGGVVKHNPIRSVASNLSMTGRAFQTRCNRGSMAGFDPRRSTRCDARFEQEVADCRRRNLHDGAQFPMAQVLACFERAWDQLNACCEQP